MNAQEIFNKAYRGVMRQGKPCVQEGTISCIYRDPADPAVRCAAGHVMVGLLPEDHPAWDPTENGAVEIIELLVAEESRLAPLRDHESLLAALQDAHDAAARWSTRDEFPREFHRSCSKIASDFHLGVPCVS